MCEGLHTYVRVVEKVISYPDISYIYCHTSHCHSLNKCSVSLQSETRCLVAAVGCGLDDITFSLESHCET